MAVTVTLVSGGYPRRTATLVESMVATITAVSGAYPQRTATLVAGSFPGLDVGYLLDNNGDLVFDHLGAPILQETDAAILAGNIASLTQVLGAAATAERV